MATKSISEIIRDSITARNSELDKLYGNKSNQPTSPRIKSTLPSGVDYKNDNEPSIMKFTQKHHGKWAVVSHERKSDNEQWRVLSVHNEFDDTIPHLTNSSKDNYIGPIYIDKNLHKNKIVGHENFL